MTQKVKNVSINRWWDTWLAVIALATITMVGIRLWVTDWTGDLYILVYLTFFAGIAGLALGVSRFSPFISALFSTVYGLFTIGWLFGTTIEREIPWRVRLLNVLGWRLRIAIEQFSAGEIVTDPILFLTLMAILLWILGTLAAFLLIRQGIVWPAFIPIGITLLVVGHYDQGLARNTRYLMTYLFFILLILGRMTFLRYRRKWHEDGIQTTTETQGDLNKTLLILTSVLLMIAWIIPLTPNQRSQYSDLWEIITKPWDRISDQFSDIFIVSEMQTPVPADNFEESLPLGSGSPLSDEIVFTVQLDSDLPAGYRNYWHERSFDYYEDADWSASPGIIDTDLFPDTFEIQYPAWETDQAAAFTITNGRYRTNKIYTSGLPFRVSRPVTALTRPISDSEENLIGLFANPGMVAGDTYQVETRVTLPTENALRMTSTDYPDWLERYLQLPEDFSDDISALAAEITRGIDNPFDQAFAITRYLRINIEYARTIPPVPPDVDPIEWFLFDEKSGFCNYYATAQVLMLRSIGIPSRIAVGYAEGEFDPLTETYTVRRRESHAWPEVYFVDYGWVPFEPTVSQPALILPIGLPLNNEELPSFQRDDLPQMDDLPPEELDPPSLDDGDVAPELDAEVDSERGFFPEQRTLVVWTMMIIFLMAVLISMAAFLWPSLFRIKIDPLPILLERFLEQRDLSVPGWLRRWSRSAKMSVPEKAYRKLGRAIKILGQPLNFAETPAERAQTFIKMVPEAEAPALDIIHEYHIDQFSNHIINEERAKNAGRKVQHLALRTRLRHLVGQRD